MSDYLDFNLRAETEADLIAALTFASAEDDGQPVWVKDTERYSLALIGPLLIEDGTDDEEGNELTPPVIDQRFHANLRLIEHSLSDEVPETIVVNPTQQKVIWL